jgi:hypothetical protein
MPLLEARELVVMSEARLLKWRNDMSLEAVRYDIP